MLALQGLILVLHLAFVSVVLAQDGTGPTPAQDPGPGEASTAPSSAAAAQTKVEPSAEAPSLIVVTVLPFRVHSAKPREHLAEALPDLLSTRLEGTGKVDVVGGNRLIDAMPEGHPGELTDTQLRGLASRLSVSAVIVGSLTEISGRYSLDVRITPATPGLRSHTLVVTADSDKDLIGRLGELAEQVLAVVSGADPGRIVGLNVVGAGPVEPDLRALIESQAGTRYAPRLVQEDRQRLLEHARVARVTVETDRKAEGVVLTFTIVRSEAILAQGVLSQIGEVVIEVEIRGNRRIEADAVRSRIRTRAGEPLNRAKLARDVREVYGLGFFQNVYVFAAADEGGVRLIFEVEENAVIREISISGNDNLDGEKITDILTLTTGSTVDYSLLHENTDRISQLYRAEGYYLVEVDYEIEEIIQGSVSVEFEVIEGEKLKLRKIIFEGNEAFTAKQLTERFSTKTWRFWSLATSWFDHSGLYSEPIFARDMREVEKLYTDSGYLQVEVSQPEVDATEEGLFVRIKVKEGPEFRVGKINVAGDETVDLQSLRDKLLLSRGDVFNRSYLTSDVESLERHYTDRGFYFASVQPGTRLSEADKTVDVQFAVEKGPLYFVRNINIVGNTTTIDPVIRREMKVVEGQLYSARGTQISTSRIRRLGYFEDVAFEPQPTDDPSQLDLNVNVVERPTGSFSFGAGYSSQDGLVFTAALSQSNLFGRGYFVNLSVNVGGRTNTYSVSVQDPYFLGSTFSLFGSISVSDIEFDTFKSNQKGFNFRLGHSLSEDNTARGALSYRWSSREVTQNTGVNAAAPIFREILQGNESSSLVGLSFNRDTRDDRFTATSGLNMGATLEYAGLGGFAKFLRAEGRIAWYLGAPSWMLDRSTFVVSTRIGYAVPFNVMSDWDLLLDGETLCDDPANCDNVGRLDQIDTDVRLPLTERYFLGGIGTFQLRGFRARTVGPRRAILQRSGFVGLGNLFHPVGTRVDFDSQLNRYVATCDDNGFTQGNGNGRCNELNTKDIDDFNDLRETDVIGGNSFISSSFEYRFPISQEVGLQGVLFVDMGNAFYEGQNLFDASLWRYGYGGGVLWFSPFGPLQLVLGFPVNPESFEESPVFEFSVGGFGL